tara:strand:+ start:418 stop:1674 length:1257 start_codon:yes stop_codon:yes gene_type:complete
MRKLILLLKLILRAKFVFKTPKEHEVIIFDKTSAKYLKSCLSKFSPYVLQARPENMDEIYFSYKILKKMLNNYLRGNLFTVYLISLIELIKAKAVITIIDNSFKFSTIAKVLEKKITFIAIQNAARYELLEFDYLYRTKKIKKNYLKKFYIPNFFSFGDYERDLYPKLQINVKNIYPAGSLRWASFLNHIKKENHSLEKYNSDICLIPEHLAKGMHSTFGLNAKTRKKINDPKLLENINLKKGFVDIIKYTIKFCIKNNMKLIIPLKRDKKYTPKAYKVEHEFYKRNLKEEEFDYFQKNFLEKERDNFSSYRAVKNSKVAVGNVSTLLRDKLGTGGKILSCNLTKVEVYNFPIGGICSLNNCTYLEFEKRLLEIYSISKESYFSKMDKKPDYVMRFNKNNSTINLIREKLLQLGVNQN